MLVITLLNILVKYSSSVIENAALDYSEVSFSGLTPFPVML